MYCPSCGSNNQAEVKFCTRCGTNLAVVSEALRGKAIDQSLLDERMVKLLKDYYRSRNSIIIGSAACAIVLLKVIFFALVSFSTTPRYLGTLTTLLLIYGIIALVWGIGKWNDSASEIKAIERAASLGASLRSAEARPGLLTDEPASIATGSPATDPLAYPGSVTEQTTCHLEEKVYKPSMESQSKQPQ